MSLQVSKRQVVLCAVLLIAFQAGWRVGIFWNTKQSIVKLMVNAREPCAFANNASTVGMLNSVEDERLQHYIASTKHPVKGVIVLLANAARLESLFKALRLLYKHFNDHFRYPVVIFHEADLLPAVDKIRVTGLISRRSSIFFQMVDINVPEWYMKKFGPPPRDRCTDRNVKYRSMCRFQSKLFYEQPIIRHFDYYWRLDDDSEIRSNITFDVFDVLRLGNFSYGYFQTVLDRCAANIFDVVNNFVKSRSIRPTFFPRLKRNEVFFNNFEVSSLKFWRSRQYRDFIEHIDALGGIYLHRWGDAPIKTLALSVYVPASEIYQYKNIDYNHHVIKEDRTKFLQ